MDGFLDTRYSTPTNEVLINKAGLTTSKELREAEGAGIGIMTRLVEGNRPVPGNFDAAHLKEIHKQLLQYLYPWAGQTRAWGQFQGQKDTARGTLFFAPYQQIDKRLNLLSDQLTKENHLKGLGKEQFVERLAYYADQYNYVHAFREGNGRTLQVVMAEVGRRAGYDVRLSKEQAEQTYNPARDTAILRKNAVTPADNLGPLRNLLKQATTEAPGADAEKLRQPDQARPLPQQQSPGMQQAEALRTVIVGAREIAEELVMQRLVKHNFVVDTEYMDKAKEQESGIVGQAQNVQRDPATWPAFREQLLERAKLVEADPDVTRASLAHITNMKAAGAELDKNHALTPAFQEREIPTDQLVGLGQSVDELWKRGQMEKLLNGERSGQLSVSIPGANGPEQVPMQLQLKRLPTNEVDVQVYLSNAIGQRIEAQQPVPTTSKPQLKEEPKGENTPGPPSPTPQQKAPAPKRRGPKL